MADKKAKERQLAEETIEAAGTAGETAAETASRSFGGRPYRSHRPIWTTSRRNSANCPPALRRHQAEAAKEKARADDLNGMASRLQADFDNYRKRTNETNKRVREEGICAVLENCCRSATS